MYIGKPIKRREDFRFLTGRGNYVDDIVLPGTTYAALVRSPHAHATIASIDTAKAARMLGVLAVLTGKDWNEAGLGSIPCIGPCDFSDGRPMNWATHQILTVDKARFVGDPVAVVIAETRLQAADAAEAVAVGYAPLPAVVNPLAALEDGAPILHEDIGTNLVFEVEHGDKQKMEAAFAAADHVTEVDLVQNRISSNPMEPRTCLGHYDLRSDRYTLYASNQMPHLLRNWLAMDILRIPEHRLRVIAPDVGGGFGLKVLVYREDAIVLWASKIVDRPVRWTATRSESLATDSHSREQITSGRMAFDKTGKILGLHVDTIGNIGGYPSMFGSSVPGITFCRMLIGPYTTPAFYARARGAYTNTTHIEVYRGAGRPEAAYMYERLLDAAARQMGIGPDEIRSRNFIPPDQFPYETPTGLLYDCANMPGLMDKAKSLANYQTLRTEQETLRKDGVLMGIGMGAFIDYSAGGPNRAMAGVWNRRMGSYEVGTVRMHPDGKVTALVGTHSHGQGHETVFCQVVADRLGCDIDDVELLFGDTDLVASGMGTAGSRSAVMGGHALVASADRVAEKCKALAAHLLECAAADIVVENGNYVVEGTDRKLTRAQVALAAYHGASFPDDDFEVGLDETTYHEPDAWVFSSAVHTAVVLVDPETGRITLRDYFAVDDSGRILNPMIVEGQIHGGVVQGYGQAVMEECVYDPESGQLLSGTFMDYAMPRAVDFPFFATGFQETLAPSNVLGVKGAGESGCLGAPPALVHAVIDALEPLGVERIDMPMTAHNVWKTIEAARASM